jgi:hypothetical protein
MGFFQRLFGSTTGELSVVILPSVAYLEIARLTAGREGVDRGAI